jgi:chromosome segregation ATPase
MEPETMLKEILNALKEHGVRTTERFDEIDRKFAEVDQRFDKIEAKLDRMDKKQDGFRVELSETQETSNFLLSKVAQHEGKLRNID